MPQYSVELRTKAVLRGLMAVIDTCWKRNPTYTTKYLSRSFATQTQHSSGTLVSSDPNSLTQAVCSQELLEPRCEGTYLRSRTTQLVSSTSTPIQGRKSGKIPHPLKFYLKECTRGLGTERDRDNISREMLCKQLPLRYIPPLPFLRD